MNAANDETHSTKPTGASPAATTNVGRPSAPASGTWRALQPRQRHIGSFGVSGISAIACPRSVSPASSLVMSRASVREAIRCLETMDLVDVRHGQGVFVREAGDLNFLVRMDTSFQDAITRRAKNHLYRDLLKHIAGLSIGSHRISLSVPGRAVQVIDKHAWMCSTPAYRPASSASAIPSSTLKLRVPEGTRHPGRFRQPERHGAGQRHWRAGRRQCARRLPRSCNRPSLEE
jgi:Bacterial regulatory proteins, gntR family